MTVEEVLVQARKLLEPGFTQRVLRSPDGLYCARGAIMVAASEPSQGFALVLTGAVRRAEAALIAANPEVAGWSVVPYWNNAPGRTHAEILAAFDAAIEAERASVRVADPAHEAVLVA